MAYCIKCGKTAPVSQLQGDLCSACADGQEEPSPFGMTYTEQGSDNADMPAPNDREEEQRPPVLTTETHLDAPIQCCGIAVESRVFGINVLKDFVAAIKDKTGGRIRSIEGSIADAIESIEKDLAKQCTKERYAGVVGLRFEHNYVPGDKSVLTVVATGTFFRYYH